MLQHLSPNSNPLQHIRYNIQSVTTFVPKLQEIKVNFYYNDGGKWQTSKYFIEEKNTEQL
jgi:hypothetical protein